MNQFFFKKNRLNIISFIFLVLFSSIYFYNLTIRFYNFPIDDDYEAFFSFLIKYFELKSIPDKVELVFAQHNEHRIAVLRSITLIYYSIFGDINLINLRIIGLFFYFGVVVLIYFIGKFNNEGLIYFLPVPLIIFSYAYTEAYVMTMATLTHFTAIFFTLSSFYSLVKIKNIFWAILFMFLGLNSNGNGMLIIPVGVFGLLIMKNYKSLTIWIVSSLAFLCLFFNNYYGGKVLADFSKPVELLKSFFTYVGGIGGFGSLKLNFALGLIAFTTTLYLFFIKKSYKKELVLTLFIISLFGSYVLISIKRSEYGPSFLQRQVYIYTSVLLFASLYCLFFKLQIKPLLDQEKTKLYQFKFILLFILLGIYQYKNYSSWLFNYEEGMTFLKQEYIEYLSNNPEVYNNTERPYNIVLVAKKRLSTLNHDHIFNTLSSLGNVLAKPIKNPAINRLTTEGLSAKITNVYGTEFIETPYLNIKIDLEFAKKNRDREFGVMFESKTKKIFFAIPVIKNSLNFFKNGKLRPLNFLVDKKKLTEKNYYVSVFKIEKDKIIRSTKGKYISINESSASWINKSTPKFLNYKEFVMDNKSEATLTEVIEKDHMHYVSLEIKIDSIKHNLPKYLIFEAEGAQNFWFNIYKDPTSNSKSKYKLKFSDDTIAKSLYKRYSIYNLSVIYMGPKEYHTIPLNKIYYFYSDKY